MESRRVEKAPSGPRTRTSVESELRWLGSRESRLVREVRRHLCAHPPAFDELGFLVDQPPLTMAEQLRPARDRLRRVHSDARPARDPLPQ